MTKHSEWTRWFRLWGSRRPVYRGKEDFADYGTAFGLDMSLAAAQAEAASGTSPSTRLKNGTSESPPYGAPA